MDDAFHEPKPKMTQFIPVISGLFFGIRNFRAGWSHKSLAHTTNIQLHVPHRLGETHLIILINFP